MFFASLHRRNSFFFLVLFVFILVPCYEMTKIKDCCCEVETIDIGNDDLCNKLISLRAETFFKIFKVDLYSECPWKADYAKCGSGECKVCPCKEHELPPVYKQELTSPVDRTLSKDFVGWNDTDIDSWIQQPPPDKLSYINLDLNAEGYTGYEGGRIWKAIYEQNCFHGPLDSYCFEQRVFYRLISGLHTSVSAHVANSFPMDGLEKEMKVGPSFMEFERRILPYPDRIENLYFSFVFLLRAVNKAKPVLEKFNYSIGDELDDKRTYEKVKRILNHRMVIGCSAQNSFNETQLFTDPKTMNLKNQFQKHFRNISLIMNCVGCEKCKLHGKLQILGLGTALKLLLSERPIQPQDLHRNEVMALMVTLAKFSYAIRMIQDIKRRHKSRAVMFAGILFVVLLSVCLTTFYCFVKNRKKKKQKTKTTKTKIF